MSHSHKHCAHTHLSYCQLCQVVYCHDCSQEWTAKQTWWGTTLTYGTSSTQYPPIGYRTMTNAESPVQMSGTHRHEG